MNIDNNNSPIDNTLKINPLIIGSLIIGVISIISCFVPQIQNVCILTSVIIAVFMAFYSIKKSVKFPFSGWIICIISFCVSVVFMEDPPNDEILQPEKPVPLVVTNELEAVVPLRTNKLAEVTKDCPMVKPVTNDVVEEAVLEDELVSANEVVTVTNLVEVIVVETQQINFASNDTNECVAVTNLNIMIPEQDLSSTTNTDDTVCFDHKFYMLVLGKLYGLKNRPEDLEVIAEIYRDKAKFANPQMEELFERFTTVACLHYNRRDLYEKYFSNTPYAWGLEKRLLDRCAKCDGLGQVYEPCTHCGFSVKVKISSGKYKTVKLPKGKCPSCRGKGVITSGFKQAGANSGQRMGKHSGGVRCATCHGTGLCQYCRGSGEIAVVCSECGGSGKALSKEKLQSAYSDLSELCVKHIDELIDQNDDKFDQE